MSTSVLIEVVEAVIASQKTIESVRIILYPISCEQFFKEDMETLQALAPRFQFNLILEISSKTEKNQNLIKELSCENVSINELNPSTHYLDKLALECGVRVSDSDKTGKNDKVDKIDKIV